MRKILLTTNNIDNLLQCDYLLTTDRQDCDFVHSSRT